MLTGKTTLLLLGLVSAAIYGVNFRIGDLLAQLQVTVTAPQPITVYLIQMALLSPLYLLAIWMTSRLRQEDSKQLATILLFAVLFRIPLVSVDPALSSDIYRYLWEGKIQVAAGMSPYIHAPEDDRLAFLRDQEIYPLINRKEAPTVYPAGAQLLFAAVHWAGVETPRGFKALALAADCLTLFFLYLILGRLRLPLSRLLIYAWNPLLIYELFYSGHLESFMLPPLLAFIYLFLRGRLGAAGAALGLAVAIKLVPALLWVTFPKGNRLQMMFPFVLVVALAYFFYAAAGTQILGFLPTYFSHPYEIFNLGLIQLALLWLARLFSFPAPWIRFVLFAFLVVVLLRIARWPYTSPADLIEKSYVIFAAYLILIYPAFHPWYLGSLLPLLCFVPSRAWILFSLLLPLSYLKYLEPGQIMPTWMTLLQFVPLYLLLAVDYAKLKWFNERSLQWCLGTQTPSSTTP